MKKAHAERLAEVARLRFLELLGDSPIPSVEAGRISIGRIPRPDGLTVTVSLLPSAGLSANGMHADDFAGITKICRLDVDAVTEEVTVTLANAVSWLQPHP
ncbi:MAG: hypothetical protein RLZZ618_44 [Pseudomonadota bacterium]